MSEIDDLRAVVAMLTTRVTVLEDAQNDILARVAGVRSKAPRSSVAVTCIESFSGVECGAAATMAAYDSMSCTWGPKCERCARAYAPDLVKPLTGKLRDECARLQAFIRDERDADVQQRPVSP